ncbi:uncharacterized protein LOC131237040 isoform X1 [Magnolia sinica]|uniref:uncharacterized protein LOC131237040 isoform X1 n=1 Tax=Magnolia sinica TaxID=86752 RepID=UPI00265A5DA7|nr:uncharacterized protein LOC131237040 isoform X1 [Magnolia sinica]
MENTETLREWFERVDSEKTSSITALQLKSAFAVGNLEFSLSVVQQMIRMYDFDRNGTMSFEEFVALNKFLMKVQNAFSALESHCELTRIYCHQQNSLRRLYLHILHLCYRGRGYLSPEDVYEALVKIGFSLDSPAFYTVCEEKSVETAAFLIIFRALIKTRRAGSGWMILYHSVYLYSQLGIYLIRLIQLSRGESRWISTSLFTALPIAEYEINFSSLEDHSA